YSPGPGYGFGLGFAVRKDTGVAPMIGSAGDYNWGGAFGTGFWVDPKEELVFMAQAPGPIRVHYRQLLKSLVLQALE
ncbi:MAG TPA: serine hydrolase, partial [Methylomirabilota bacterium]|nr:serine hydrolase [Methylomirabilota bacterium]